MIKGVKDTGKRKISTKELFQYYMSNGIISLDDIVGSDEENIMSKIRGFTHKYKIGITKDGMYYTYVPDVTKPHGRRQIRKKSRRELDSFLVEFYMEAQEKGMPFENLYAQWVEYKKMFVGASNKSRGLSPSTIRRFERDYDKYLDGTKLARTPIRLVTSVFLESQMIEMIREHSMKEHCAGNVIGYIGQAFRYARRSRLLEEDPMEFVDKRLILAMCEAAAPKADMDRILSLSEMQKLKEAVMAQEKKHPKYMPNYAIELAMMTGMRAGELTALQWSCIRNGMINIEFSEHRLDYRDKPSELIIGEPKNGKHRMIPVTDEIQAFFDKLRELPTYDPDGFLFNRPDGSRCTGHDVGCAASRRAQEAGITNTSIHEIRRTVSSMLRTILPVRSVANMLGHLETTNELYYNYDITEKEEKIRALSSLSDLSSNIINFRDKIAG